MFRPIKRITVLALAALSLAAAGPLQAEQRLLHEEPTSGEVMADVLLARPAGLVATVVGSAIFFLSTPFLITTGDVDLAAEKLIKEPADYTITRPLGEDF